MLQLLLAECRDRFSAYGGQCIVLLPYLSIGTLLILAGTPRACSVGVQGGQGLDHRSDMQSNELADAHTVCTLADNMEADMKMLQQPDLTPAERTAAQAGGTHMPSHHMLPSCAAQLQTCRCGPFVTHCPLLCAAAHGGEADREQHNGRGAGAAGAHPRHPHQAGQPAGPQLGELGGGPSDLCCCHEAQAACGEQLCIV